MTRKAGHQSKALQDKKIREHAIERLRKSIKEGDPAMWNEFQGADPADEEVPHYE